MHDSKAKKALLKVIKNKHESSSSSSDSSSYSSNYGDMPSLSSDSSSSNIIAFKPTKINYEGLFATYRAGKSFKKYKNTHNLFFGCPSSCNLISQPSS